MTEPRPLFVLPSLKPGGAEIQSLRQIRAMRGRGMDAGLVLLSERNDPEMLAALELPAERLMFAGTGGDVLDRRFLAALPGRVPRIARFVRRVRPTHLLCIMPPAFVAGRLARLALALSGPRPRLVIWHRNFEQEILADRSPATRLYLAVNGALARLLDDQHWHISRDVRAAVTSAYFTRGDRVIHNSVDPVSDIDDGAARDVLAQAGVPETAYTILTPGRLHEQKGHLVLLAALGRLAREEGLGPERVRLVIAGDGPMREAILEARAREGLEAHVRLVGPQPHATILGLMRAADLVCMPSLREGFGNVAIEALMAETLLVVSRTGGLAEIVRDGVNGFSVPPGDAEALAGRLGELVRAGGTHGIDLAAARADCLERFSLDRQVDAILAALS